MEHKKIWIRLKKEKVLWISLLMVLGISLWVPFGSYSWEAIEWDVIGILFLLMAVVGGLSKSGFFGFLTNKMTSKTKNIKVLAVFMVFLCFFLSMAVTNDVALFFVIPLSFMLFQGSDWNFIMYLVILENIAANLGSAFTPIGNPQNLYLYTHYQMTVASFFQITTPLFLFSLGVMMVLCLAVPKGFIQVPFSKEEMGKKKDMIFYIFIFILCICIVLNLLPKFPWALFLVGILLIKDWRIFLQVDYFLLATFICFFIFSEHVTRIPQLEVAFSQYMKENPILLAAGISQVISNVPAAVVLSHFTDNPKTLLLGTNIGGLGTLIASLANLIAYKLYVREFPQNKKKYILKCIQLNFLLWILFYFAFQKTVF